MPVHSQGFENIAAAKNFLGTWDAAAGALPAAGHSAGDYYTVSVAGLIDGIEVGVDDWIVAVAPTTQTAQWGGEWIPIDANLITVSTANLTTNTIDVDGDTSVSVGTADDITLEAGGTNMLTIDGVAKTISVALDVATINDAATDAALYADTTDGEIKYGPIKTLSDTDGDTSVRVDTTGAGTDSDQIVFESNGDQVATLDTTNGLIIDQHDLEVTSLTGTHGVILTSPDGTRWRLTMSNVGAIVATSL